MLSKQLIVATHRTLICFSPIGAVFDNSYFTTIPDKNSDPELLKLSTDETVFDDEAFRPFAEKFRDSQDAFFESYAKAHKKLSEVRLLLLIYCNRVPICFLIDLFRLLFLARIQI
jgi:hypothetical protein